MKWIGFFVNVLLAAMLCDVSAADPIPITVPERTDVEVRPSNLQRESSTGTVQSQSAAETRSQIRVGLNFTGATIFDSGFIPPDTMGAVGPNHIIELINGRYSVYRKNDGVLLESRSLDDFWRAAGVNSIRTYTFDPRILYDPFSQRWFASSGDNPGELNHFLVAVSRSADPTQGWNGFAIDSDSSTNRHWVDFPTLGFNKDGVYLSGNMFLISGGPGQTTVVVIPKKDLLGTIPTVANATKFENLIAGRTGSFAQPVVDLDNAGLPEILLSTPAFISSSLKRSQVVGSIASPTLDTSDGDIPVTSLPARSSAEQPGPKPNLDISTGSSFSAGVVKQNGSLWGVQTVDVGGRAALRWFQIDANTNAVLQQGLIADDDLEFYYGSIAVNKFDDVVIGFNGSAESQFASSYAVVGNTFSGFTTFNKPLLLKAGVATYENGNINRWGDYSATIIDPSDPFTFWTLQEFVLSEDRWATQITQILFPAPENLNDLVSLSPDPSSFNTTGDASGCPDGFVGTFSFSATLRNGGSRSLSHLIIRTNELTNGNLLQNANYGPGGAGASLAVPASGSFADRLLSPHESVDVAFSICLQKMAGFNFFVDVLGNQAESDLVASRNQ